MTQVKSVLKRYGLLLLAASVLAIGLKCAAYAVPGDRVRQNIELSVSQLETEGLYPSPFIDVWNVPGVHLDNWSDSNYLNICYYADTHSLLESAAGDYLASVPGAENPLEMFLSAVTGTSDTLNFSPYARQWMGVNSILRPLLYFFTFPQIRLISQYGMLLLLGIAGICISRRTSWSVAVFYLMALLSVNLVAGSSSANFAGPLFWVLFSSIMTVKLYPEKAGAPVCVFTAAMGTAYFDAFVAPLMTFCVLTPLILWIGYERREIRDAARGFWIVFKCGVAWLTGYLSLWMVKWALASVVLKENIFLEAFREATSAVTGWNIEWAAEETTAEFMLSANRLNLSQVFPFNLLQGRPAGWWLLAAVLVLIAFIVFRSRRTFRLWWWKAGLLVLTGLAPYAWYTVVYKHSYMHYWFTFRLQAGTVLAILLALAVIWREGKREPTGVQTQAALRKESAQK